MLALLLYVLLGIISGIIAALLGIGGGSVIVPILVAIFTYTGENPLYIQHMALATSMATIVITAISSSRAHYRHNAVRLDIVKSITPGILIGTFGGSFVASYLSGQFLTIFFVIFLYLMSIQMLLNAKPKPTRHLPSMVGITGVGSGIGIISSLVGIGGGSLSVPFMTYCNVPMHTAVGTSAAIGLPIAIAGTFGYILGGLQVEGLPAGTIGYVNIVAFACVAVASYFTAPLGAKLSHKLPIATLKRFFAVFLMFVATNMLIRSF